MPFGAIWSFSESVAELDYRHVLLGESCHLADPAARHPRQWQTCALTLSNFQSAGSHPAVLPSRVQASRLVTHRLTLTYWLPPAGLGMGVVAAGLGLIFMRIHKIIHKLTRAVGLHVGAPLNM